MLKLIGKFGVDSGQAMIGDPCYLESWKNWQDKAEPFENHPQHKGQYSYLGACNATIENSYGELGHGSSVVFSTGYGDGVYPVFAEIDDGRIVKIVVDFNGTLDENGNEVDEYA
jgi:hypothetical protein